MLLMKTEFGSHLYGLSTPESDRDYKSVFVPTFADVVLKKSEVECRTSNEGGKNTKDDVDTENMTLHHLMMLLFKGETNSMAMLHSRNSNLLETSEEWEYLYEHRAEFYTTRMDAYLGYACGQAKRYSMKGDRYNAVLELKEIVDSLANYQKGQVRVQHLAASLPVNDYMMFETVTTDVAVHQHYTVCGRRFDVGLSCKQLQQCVDKLLSEYGERTKRAADMSGADWKAYSHAMRACFEVLGVYRTGDLVYPLKDREYLMKVKLGQVPMVEASGMLENLVEEVRRETEIAKKNGLRDKVDRAKWENWMIDVYRKYAK